MPIQSANDLDGSGIFSKCGEWFCDGSAMGLISEA